MDRPSAADPSSPDLTWCLPSPASCNKLMDSTNVTQREEELFCKTCYGRNFGPKGYGFGGGSAGVLSMDDGTKYKVRSVPAHCHTAALAATAGKVPLLLMSFDM